MEVPKVTLKITTPRLIIEPVQQHHAEQMLDVISSPDLYTYIPFDPPTLEQLKNRYRRWEPRISPEKDEIWLNWVIRLKSENTYIGDLQAGYKENNVAYVAYMLNKDYQQQGYATESLTAIIDMLFHEMHVDAVRAFIDTRNQKSIDLVRRLKMTQVEFIPKADHFKGTRSDEHVFEITRQEWIEL